MLGVVRPRRAPLALLAVLLAVALGAAACSDDDEPATSSEGSALGAPCPEAPAPTVDEDGAPDFGEGTVTVRSGAGEEVTSCVLVADVADERAQGLMGVTDLGGYDGMLFTFAEPVDGAFHMRDTPSPLSIAWFDAAGALVSTADMDPCVGATAEADECPSYPAGAPFAYALEVPQGGLEAVGVDGPDAVLVLDEG